MTKNLGLTADQQQQVAAILKAQAEQGKALRDDTSLSKEQRREKMQAQGKATREKIRALLTPEQQAKLDAMPQRGRRGPGGPEDAPPAQDGN